MKRSKIYKRSLMIGGHKTSVSLEDEFWIWLQNMARERGTSLAKLASEIDKDRENANLSSALRLAVLQHLERLLAAQETAGTGAGP